MQHNIRGQKACGNAMTRRHEAGRPEHRRANATRDSNKCVAASALGNWRLGR
jgi:hypothetical protein